MSRLIPDGFLTVRQAAEKLAVAMFLGVPDRPVVKKLKEDGFDVADGVALEDAGAEIWAAVDGARLQALIIGAKRRAPLKLPAEMSKGIPGLRNPRGGGFSLLRHRNPYRQQIVEWFGADLSTIAIVFREQDITKLARTLLRARRRRLASASSKKLGRPSRQEEAKVIILQLVEERRWSATQSLKALTQAVNRRAKCPNPISEDTVARALVHLHEKTGDRRFERLRRGR